MQIPDTLLAQRLSSVYWIMGGPCGGKTTQAEALCQKHSMLHYNADQQMPKHKELANPVDHPALCRPFEGWERYFGQPIEEYRAWLKAANDEAFGMVMLDLVGLAFQQKVIYEGHTSVELVCRVADKRNAIYLSPTEDVVRRDYLGRRDHRDMVELIRTLPKAEEICEKLLLMAIMGNREGEARARELGIPVIRRTAGSGTTELSAQIESQFGLAVEH